jgi:hypothetical protein
MNSAKLRRSRDVSEPKGSKIVNRFTISHLVIFQHGLGFQSRRDELVHQAADLIAKSQLGGRPPDLQPPHISSGRHRTARPVRGVLAL